MRTHDRSPFCHMTALLLMLIALVSPDRVRVSESEAYANPEILMETWELQQRLGDADLRVVDLRPPAEYVKGHIPTAMSLDPATLDDPEANRIGLAVSMRKAREILGALGIDGQTRVIAYDDAGGLHAARLFYVLESFGHLRAALLNGGWSTWVAEGRPRATDVPAIAERRFVIAPAREHIKTAEDVRAGLRRGLRRRSVLLLDARSPAEYAGAVAGKDVRRAGHIPGAVNIHWSKTIDPARKTFRPTGELRRLFTEAGATRDKELITYCRTGQQSAHLYFAARLLRYSRVSNYDGSWLDWSNHTEFPVAK